MHVFLQFKHYFGHIIKGKLGSDVGQPGILTGDTRVSQTQPSGLRTWDTLVSPCIPGCPTSSPRFPMILLLTVPFPIPLVIKNVISGSVTNNVFRPIMKIKVKDGIFLCTLFS